MKNRNKIIYWSSTVILSLGFFLGAIAQLIKEEHTTEAVIRLGYPLYLMNILGTWKILGVIILLLPKYPLIKEWAYAGFIFVASGAAISHIVSGDNLTGYIGPVIYVILIITSWYFRPADRKITMPIN
ncbi:DoxX family protein [Dyadobacter tibetensis]|uniref:DoxX family protein n=1 Tax=Dyadobacter tibetensis TaxID=1211851 RepID=UPI00046F9727|nr:DoxX family protein [Dyadobacter tibetensis]